MKKENYYQIRLNRSLQFVNDHLHEEIAVQQLAHESGFSLYHFQRIFKSCIGETPYDYILRLRLEKAIFLLQNFNSKKIEDIAYSCGFNSFENFSRQFKKRFGFTASQFQNDDTLKNSRIYQEPHPQDFYLAYEKGRKLALPNFNVTIEKQSATPIAFVRGIFGEDGSVLLKAYQTLIDWATDKGIFPNGQRYGMSLDNPEVTPAHKYRYDFAIAVPKGFQGDGVIEIGEIPAAHFATLHCQGDIQKVAQAWDFLYKNWLPENEYVPMHYPAIEEFVKGPEEIGWTNFDIKCKIPLEKLNI